jgi:hypothetical protein
MKTGVLLTVGMGEESEEVVRRDSRRLLRRQDPLYKNLPGNQPIRRLTSCNSFSHPQEHDELTQQRNRVIEHSYLLSSSILLLKNRIISPNNIRHHFPRSSYSSSGNSTSQKSFTIY